MTDEDELNRVRQQAGELFIANHIEKHAAHDELAKERWDAHQAKHADEKELEASKWQAHADQHDSIAHNLSEYKMQSNEWRGSLADLRLTFITKTEADTSHQSLVTQIDTLEKALANEREERRDQQNLRVGQEEGISRTAAIAVTAIGLVGTLLGGLAVLLNILK
jgi:hypothetical protein